ncbi:d2223a85-d7ae-43f0-8107-a9b3d1d3dd7b [Thermothielavioides terrestris]|uniref:Uncharacterized protein n=2 Tax=Thermothielavioides terrestris TaxID=2587410 RepID=G2R583_THETT|nr:uncharacterized protein THITE_2114071 [Thermothielavioides terrestris NRRL 8126]AEO66166.1 hypothetical protein THITE_2114071 [Thermothielavioides terrestris NRRL 8126]SPQ18573.1 d2223a85-d7ae-43f0-8107-a9b3d1d3dd7b [Thermothielavioides terrestris]
MSSENPNTNTNPNDMARQRHGSVTSSAFASLFRNNSVSQPPVTAFPTPLASTAVNDQRRRLSVTTLGLSGSSPTTPSALLRRASLSTNSDSIDENAIEDDDARTTPAAPFSRRMSFGATQAMRSVRGPTSPGTSGRQPQQMRRSSTVRGSPATPPLPTTGVGNYTWGKITSQASTANQPRTSPDLCSPPGRSDQGFNWSDQLRSRAESAVAAGSRPSFSFASGLSSSPPRAPPGPATAPVPGPLSPRHDRARSVSDMPRPPAQPPKPRAPQKPDPFQERILKGDFYMD